jgi:acyl-CoA thioester hydrolase
VTGYSVTIAPRFYETDALGHINNAAIAAWFEVARVGYLESLGNSGPHEAKNWVLASLQIDFLAETFYGTDVIADIIDARIGNSSLTVICVMSQDGKMTVRGTAVLVHMDAQTKSSTPIPDTLRQRIAAR